MRLFDLFENAEPSDDELFGGDESWGAIPSIIKMLRGYYISTLHDLDSYDGDVRDELEDEAEQADCIADVLAKGEKRKGIELLLSLDHQTRGTMTEFLKSYNVDMAKVYSSVLGTTPHWLTEDEPSDDDLFGASKYNIAEIVDLLVAIGTHYHRTSDAELVLDDADVVLDAADNFQKRGMRAGADRLMDVNQPSVMGYLTAMFREKLGVNINDMFKEFGTDMYESSEPSDTDLFGEEEPLFGRIQKLLRNKTNVSIKLPDGKIYTVFEILSQPRTKNFATIVYGNPGPNNGRHGSMSMSKLIDQRNLYITASDNGFIITPKMSESTEPNDDELFGDDISPQWKLINLIDQDIDFNESQIRILKILSNTPDGATDHSKVIEQRQKNVKRLQEYKQAFKHSMRDGMALWRHDLEEKDIFKNPYRNIAIKLRGDARYEEIDISALSESTEPSDSDLFGDEDIQLQTRAIKVLEKLIANTNAAIQSDLRELGVSSVKELDPWENEAHEEAYDEMSADLRAIKYYSLFVQQFKKNDVAGLVAWHNEIIRGSDGEPAAEMLEYEFEQAYGITLQSYFDELNESAEPSDEELFGEMKYDPRKIGDVATTLGMYIIDNQDDEGMDDETFTDGRTLLHAGEQFKNYGMLAGINALEYMESLSAWEQLETDLAHTLGIDLNEMIDAYTSAG